MVFEIMANDYALLSLLSKNHSLHCYGAMLWFILLRSLQYLTHQNNNIVCQPVTTRMTELLAVCECESVCESDSECMR